MAQPAVVVPRLNRGRQRDAGAVLAAASNARRPLRARLPFQLIGLKGHAASCSSRLLSPHFYSSAVLNAEVTSRLEVKVRFWSLTEWNILEWNILELEPTGGNIQNSAAASEAKKCQIPTDWIVHGGEIVSKET